MLEFATCFVFPVRRPYGWGNKLPIFDVYSKRAKRTSGNSDDVYQYDSMSAQLRVQIQMVFKDALGPKSDFDAGEPSAPWTTVRDIVCREHGIHTLNEKKTSSGRYSELLRKRN